ncbi:MAG TPA: class I SAM-dependent methyltransferase [Solirubrobacterales bacterium]|nr:class I SAM-dependent methyltransferase [Solirubrobacterales bacterium]
MRDPLGLNERFFAWYYPKLVGASERAGQAETRRQLLSDATGRTLEIGAGSGFNLPHYTERVTQLVVSEPSPHMREHLHERLESDPPPVGSWELVDAGAEALPFDDASFDTVTGGFIMCSIPDPAAALDEIARVLKPGGRYIFLEHVHAGEGTTLGRFQDLIEVPHRYFAAGCHPNRRTGELIEGSPLEIERLERGEMPRSMPSVRPTIFGAAVRPLAA